MIKPISPWLGASVVTLSTLTVLVPALPARAGVRVEAQLSAQELPSPQPVELTVSALSSNGPTGAPDLSALERDFQILDRRVERRTSVTQGKRREEVRLRLMLLPRRAGDLEVPGIAFGDMRSEPLRLTVKGEDPGVHAEAPRVTTSPPLLDPGRFEPRGPLTSDPFRTDYYGDWGPGPWPGPTPAPESFDSTALKPGGSTPSQTPRGSVTGSVPAPPTEPTKTSGRTLRNPWFWISLALAATLAGVLGRRRGHAPSRQALGAQETPGLEPLPPDPLEAAVQSVRAAYHRGDGGAAREALLNWGRLRWPQDPPGNLARLARRLPPPLRDHITELEKAFFSPDPIHWERAPVPEELLVQSPARGRDPAAA